jgi:hypothetical protein
VSAERKQRVGGTVMKRWMGKRSKKQKTYHTDNKQAVVFFMLEIYLSEK